MKSRYSQAYKPQKVYPIKPPFENTLGENFSIKGRVDDLVKYITGSKATTKACVCNNPELKLEDTERSGRGSIEGSEHVLKHLSISVSV